MERQVPQRKPDLLIMVSEAFPQDYGEDLAGELTAPNLTVSSLRMPSGPFAGLELYLPTALALFIASSYFSGIIGKIGENHFEVVKRVARQLYARGAGVRVTPIGTVGKVSQTRKLSLTYSIIGELTPRVNFKLMLATEIPQGDAHEAIDAFLNLVRAIHFDEIPNEELAGLLTHRAVGGIVLVTFDAETGRIIPIDPKE
jgi:hypothetical protein